MDFAFYAKYSLAIAILLLRQPLNGGKCDAKSGDGLGEPKSGRNKLIFGRFQPIFGSRAGGKLGGHLK
jgi:hypothetical protein